MLRLAILDDYPKVALSMAQWSRLDGIVDIDVFDKPLAEDPEAAEKLEPYDIICLMRERMPFPGALIDKLPNLKQIVATGPIVRNLDVAAARDRGISVSGTEGYGGEAAAYTTAELAWGLLMATARNIVQEDRALRAGGWQHTFGMDLRGSTLGIVGLGNLGKIVAEYGKAFGMKVISWSPTLDPAKALGFGVVPVEKNEFFESSDAIILTVYLTPETTGLVSAKELALMKSTAVLVNIARGPIVVEQDLIDALESGAIAGAGLDVYDVEPLPVDHPLRRVENVTLTPHLGPTTQTYFGMWYEQVLEAVEAWIAGKPALRELF